MSITDIAAWYAAAVATAVFAWDIIKWIRSAARLRVITRCNVTYADARVIEAKELESGSELATLATYCHIEVLNTGSQPTTVLSIEATHKPTSEGRQMSHTGPAFILHERSGPLPALLGPGEVWSCRIEMSRLESISKYGTPVIRVRASHRTKLIERKPDLQESISKQVAKSDG